MSEQKFIKKNYVKKENENPELLRDPDYNIQKAEKLKDNKNPIISNKVFASDYKKTKRDKISSSKPINKLF